MERCKLGAFITNLGKFNEGEIVGEWINFPIKQEEFQKVLDRIGINEIITKNDRFHAERYMT